MKTVCSLALSLITAMATAATAAPSWAEGNLPVYTPGQYSARLDQSTQEWQLLPLAEADVRVVNHDPDCLSTTILPSGLWLVTRDGVGRLQLLAASDTQLPADQAEIVPLRTCTEPAQDRAIRVPAGIFDVLKNEVGAVLIDG